MRNIILALATVATLAACASRPDPTPTGPTGPTTPPVTQPSGPTPGSVEDFRVSVGDRVFFGYDRFDLSTEARAVLERQAAWLRRYPNVRVLVAGNCDERGTREYNLALGARRAANPQPGVPTLRPFSTATSRPAGTGTPNSPGTATPARAYSRYTRTLPGSPPSLPPAPASARPGRTQPPC